MSTSQDAQNNAVPTAPSPDISVGLAAQAETSRVPEIISSYTMRIRLISRCAREYISLAQKTSQEWRSSQLAQLGQCKQDLEFLAGRAALDEADRAKLTLVLTFLTDRNREYDIQYHALAQPSDMLSQSLLIFAFSAFDAFVGVLVAQLCQEESQLIHKFEQKTVTVHELLDCDTIKEVLNRLIERDIDALLRHSYDDIFTALAKRHGLETLKKFPNWPKFIEAGQRRNLITHCNGIVNAQYIVACKRSGVTLAKKVTPGYQLKVGPKYLQCALDILYEVGVKLGHTLWRTGEPSRIEESEKCLGDEVYQLLCREEWSLAKVLGEFAMSFRRPKRDLYNRIARINYAQAMKWSGDNAGAMTVLDSTDWSSSIRDLRLGVEVLRGNFDEAVALMKGIGKNGELVNQPAYREWPLFREFRTAETFKLAYSEVYGEPFPAEPKQGTPIRTLNAPQLTNQEHLDKILKTGEETMSTSPLPEIKPDNASVAESGKPGSN
jgi:hypothetical protein